MTDDKKAKSEAELQAEYMAQQAEAGEIAQSVHKATVGATEPLQTVKMESPHPKQTYTAYGYDYAGATADVLTPHAEALRKQGWKDVKQEEEEEEDTAKDAKAETSSKSGK